MKRCSRCQSTYADFVEFCFEDGEVLVPDEAGVRPKPSATMEAMDPTEAPPLPPRPLARPPVPPVRRDFPVRGAAAGEAFEAPVAGSAATTGGASPPSEDLTTEVEEFEPLLSSEPVDEQAEHAFWEENPAPLEELVRSSRKPLWLGLGGLAAIVCGVVLWALVGGDAPEERPSNHEPTQTAVAIAEVPPQAAARAAPVAALAEEPAAEVPEVDEGEESTPAAIELPDDEVAPVEAPPRASNDEGDRQARTRTRSEAAQPRPRPQPATKPRPQPAANIGSVTIESEPKGSGVFIDGEGKGETPLTVELAYGEHALELRRSGRAPYSAKINVDKPIMAVPLVTLASSLFGEAPAEEEPSGEAQPVTWINLTVVWVGHDGHKLHIDGAEKGELPVSVRVGNGIHVFEVVAPDGTSESERREVTEGQGGVLTFGI
jgi:hypothetical protein